MKSPYLVAPLTPCQLKLGLVGILLASLDGDMWIGVTVGGFTVGGLTVVKNQPKE